MIFMERMDIVTMMMSGPFSKNSFKNSQRKTSNISMTLFSICGPADTLEESVEGQIILGASLQYGESILSYLSSESNHLNTIIIII